MIADNTRDELPDWLRAAAILGTLGGLLILEYCRGLRKQIREPKLRRDVRNLVVAATAGLVMQVVERPLSLRVSREVARRRWGIAQRVPGGALVRTLVAVSVLDYGLYGWHVLTHRIPLLWRFHLVHHMDLDMDATTALRFHFGEMLWSVPWRLLQIVVAGASPLAVSTWQTLLFVSILFHHSNVEVPLGLERWLRYLVMTPRLHGLHHEARRERSNSNWSSGLALWDLLHGTQIWEPAAEAEALGVPAYRGLEDVELKACLTVPFRPQRDDWQLSGARTR